jgi:hypothetical protein
LAGGSREAAGGAGESGAELDGGAGASRAAERDGGAGELRAASFLSALVVGADASG